MSKLNEMTEFVKTACKEGFEDLCDAALELTDAALEIKDGAVEISREMVNIFKD